MSDHKYSLWYRNKLVDDMLRCSLHHLSYSHNSHSPSDCGTRRDTESILSHWTRFKYEKVANFTVMSIPHAAVCRIGAL